MKCKDCGNTHPALPGFPNHVLCDYYHLHMSNISDASRCEHFKPKVITRADRIRAMTDEELAKLLTDAQCPSDLGGTDKCENPPPHTSLDSILCRECWLDWLRQEATQ